MITKIQIKRNTQFSRLCKFAINMESQYLCVCFLVDKEMKYRQTLKQIKENEIITPIQCTINETIEEKIVIEKVPIEYIELVKPVKKISKPEDIIFAVNFLKKINKPDLIKKITFPTESVKELPNENNEIVINNISNNDVIIPQIQQVENIEMEKVEEKEKRIYTDTDRKACILVKKIEKAFANKINYIDVEMYTTDEYGDKKFIQYYCIRMIHFLEKVDKLKSKKDMMKIALYFLSHPEDFKNEIHRLNIKINFIENQMLSSYEII